MPIKLLLWLNLTSAFKSRPQQIAVTSNIVQVYNSDIAPLRINPEKVKN